MFIRNSLNIKKLKSLLNNKDCFIQNNDFLKIRFKDLDKIFGIDKKFDSVSSDLFLIRFFPDFDKNEYYINHFNLDDVEFGNCYTVCLNDGFLVSDDERYPRENKFCYIDLSESELNQINKPDSEPTKISIQNEIAKIFPDQKVFTSLFTVENGNPKTEKGKKLKVHTKILHMSPSDTSKGYFLDILKKWESIKEIELINSKENYLNNSNFENDFNEIDSLIKKLKAYEKFGFNFCAMASLGCIKACLFNSGNPVYDNQNKKTNARHKRSIVFIVLRDLFLRLLKLEIDASFKSFNTNPKFKDYDYLGFRLNGTQDSLWESIRFENDESVIDYIIRNNGIPYDYTKYINRHTKKNFPKGYSLTFSYSGDNLENCIKAYESGLNIAIPFIGSLPKYFKLGKHKIPVFNGDESDCRFLDPKNHIIGLKFKFDTKNKIDRTKQIQDVIESGFAIDSQNNSNAIGVL